MKVGRAFLQTLASQVVQSAASIATAILIARGLGPAGQGVYAVLVAAVGLLSTIGAGGQFEGHILTAAGQRSQGRLLLVRSVLQAVLVLGILALAHAAWDAPLGLAGGPMPSIGRLFLVVLFLEVLALLFRGINLGQHHITAYNVTTLVQRAAFLAAIGAFTLTSGLDVPTVLAAWIGAVGISVTLGGVWIWRQSARASVSWEHLAGGWLRSLVRGLRALLTISLTLLLIRTDVYMLGPMLGVAAVGQVSVATTFTEYLWYVPSIMGSVLFAAAASARGSETVAKICRATRTTMAFAGAAVIVLASVGHRIVPALYGSAFSQAGGLVILLLPGMLAMSLHLVLDSYFAGRGFPPISYLSVAGAVALKVLANLVLVPRMGLKGAALATSIAYLALLTSKIVAFTRETGAPVRTVLWPTVGDLWRNVREIGGWMAAVGRARA